MLPDHQTVPIPIAAFRSAAIGLFHRSSGERAKRTLGCPQQTVDELGGTGFYPLCTGIDRLWQA